mmetsp:Transcript_4476/g.9776  ORF Transcript_4476/g.9776 Transcript_4476/m.9776 type:complete len:233 (-) Transcript_4476:94-792(-)
MPHSLPLRLHVLLASDFVFKVVCVIVRVVLVILAIRPVIFIVLPKLFSRPASFARAPPSRVSCSPRSPPWSCARRRRRAASWRSSSGRGGVCRLAEREEAARTSAAPRVWRARAVGEEPLKDIEDVFHVHLEHVVAIAVLSVQCLLEALVRLSNFLELDRGGRVIVFVRVPFESCFFVGLPDLVYGGVVSEVDLELGSRFVFCHCGRHLSEQRLEFGKTPAALRKGSNPHET